MAQNASSGVTTSIRLDASFAEVMDDWTRGGGRGTSRALEDAVSRAPGAVFWECPPLTPATMARPFECVLVPAPSLDRGPTDPRPFAEHFADARDPVVAFDSLQGDARLVAPVPGGRDYPHLRAFVLDAPIDARDALWRIVARELTARCVGSRPRWLSTSGLGVRWLHVRIDSRPKYITHAEYREVEGAG